MEKKSLLTAFPVILNSNHGIQSLYSLLKSLAIRGKLDAGCTDNCRIENLLFELIDHKNRFMESRGLKERPGQQSTETMTIDFELPSDWGLVPLREICFAQAGYAFSASLFNSDKMGLPLIRIRDIDRGFSETYYSGEYRDEYLVKNGDWLIGMDGNFNVRQWQGGVALLNQRVTRLHFYDDRINQSFIALALEEHLHSLMGTKSYTTVDHLSTKQIEAAPIPLPCIAEQNAVISCMTELKGTLDRLRETENAVRLLNSEARTSAIDAISKSQTPEELRIAWERINDNWECIANTPEAIEEIRILILDLALRGHFTAKNSQKSDFNRNPKAMPYPIPAHWKWCTLQEITQDLGQEAPSYDFSYIDVASIDNRLGIISENLKILSAKDAPSRARKRVLQGSVLYSTVRPYLRNIAIVDREFTPKAIASTAFAVLYPIESVSPEFLFFCLRSNFFKSFVESKQKGVAYPAINGSDLRSALLPIPPLGEQQEIVEVVSNLFRLCEQFESALSQKIFHADAFSESIVPESA